MRAVDWLRIDTAAGWGGEAADQFHSLVDGEQPGHARRELNGEVVARKPNGQPWDHVDEVRNAQRGLVNRVK